MTYEVCNNACLNFIVTNVIYNYGIDIYNIKIVRLQVRILMAAEQANKTDYYTLLKSCSSATWKHRWKIVFVSPVLMLMILLLLISNEAFIPLVTTIDLSSSRQHELLQHWRESRKREKNNALWEYQVKNENERKYIDITSRKSKTNIVISKPVKHSSGSKKLTELFKDLRVCYDNSSVNTPQVASLIIVYNLTKPAPWKFDCVKLSTWPVTKICLYKSKQDVFVSKSIKETGMWEPHIVTRFKDILYNNPGIGVIDVGTNLGIYSLLAARMGHKVLGIEPNIETIKRFHQAVYLNNASENITLLQNAVSNTRGCTSLTENSVNQGDTRLIEAEDSKVSKYYEKCENGDINVIIIDDIIPYLTFQRAVMKLDIQKMEHLAMAGACELLRHIDIPYIFMEWVLMRDLFVTKEHRSQDKWYVEEMIRYLVSEGYQPYSAASDALLEADYWFGWPEDVIWKHKTVTTKI